MSSEGFDVEISNIQIIVVLTTLALMVEVLCVALTGRAPFAGCHVPANRKARVRIDVALPATFDDALFPLLGYLAGELSPSSIPVLTVRRHLSPWLSLWLSTFLAEINSDRQPAD